MARENQTIQSTHLPALLQTKLMPPRLHDALVPRAELVSRFTAGLAKRVTLVTAPTGYGKTTLVSLGLAAQGLPFAWVNLDENDGDPVRFMTYLLNGMRQIHPDLGKSRLNGPRK